MNRKDKAFSDSNLGDLDSGVNDESVRLPARSDGSDSEGNLRRTKAFMRSHDPTEEFLERAGGENLAETEINDLTPEKQWEVQRDQAPRMPVGFTVLGFGAILALVVWAAVVLSRGERRVDSEVADLSSRWERKMLKHNLAVEFFGQIEDAAAHYFSAETLEEKVKYARSPDRVLPLMGDYYKSRPLESRTFKSVNNLAPLGLDNRPFFVLSVALRGEGESDEVVSLVVEQGEDGRVLFDWESEVAYQPVSLERYIAEKPTEPMDLRVYVKLDHFYSYEFSDQDRYQSVMLTERDSKTYLFGYTEKGSKADLAIRGLLKGVGKRREPVILRVRFLPGTESRRSVLIEEVVAPRWILVEEPNSEKS